MVGRKRKIGEREPNGQLKRSSQTERERMSPALQKRIEMLGREKALDARTYCQIAKLRWNGEITEEMEVAAHKIGEIYGRWERCIGRSRSAKSVSYELGYSGRDLMTAEEEAARDERERKARQALEDLQEEMKLLPRDLRDAIETLCVEDRHVPSTFYKGFRGFFGKLATKWHIKSEPTHGGARAGAGRKPVNADAKTQVVEKPAPAAGLKVSSERVRWLKAMRHLRPDLRDSALQESYEYWTALGDKNVNRAELDRKYEHLRPPAYLQSAPEIAPDTTNGNPPVPEPSTQEEDV